MISGKIVREAVQAMQSKYTNSAILKEKPLDTLQDDKTYLSEDRKQELKGICNKLSTRSPYQRLGPPLTRSFLWGGLSLATGAILLAAVIATAPASSLLIQLTFAAIVISGTLLIFGTAYASYCAVLKAYQAYQELKHGKSIVGKVLLTEQEKDLALKFVCEEITTKHAKFDRSLLADAVKEHFSEIITEKEILEILNSSLEKVPLFPSHLQTALKTWLEHRLRLATNTVDTSTNDQLIPKEIQKVLSDEITQAFKKDAKALPDWRKIASQICKEIEVPFLTYSLKKQLGDVIEQTNIKLKDMVALREEELQKREEQLQRREEKLQRREEKTQAQSKETQNRHEALQIEANKIREEKAQIRLQKEAEKIKLQIEKTEPLTAIPEDKAA